MESDRPAPADVAKTAWDAFRLDAESAPAITLRGGAACDDYRDPPPYDAALDSPTDDYLERYAFHGLPYLDAASWRHYLPRLIDYAMRHLDGSNGMVVEGLLWSLRPPDREPPRLAAITPGQEQVIVSFLERLAFGDERLPERDLALQVMEEWWIPGALYRPPDQAGG